MALIKIVKEGQNPMIIPAGAYKMYAKAGWAKEKSSRRNEKEEEKPQVEEPEIEEPQVEEEEEDEDVEYVDPEDLAKRPLGELDKEELQILAEYKGIDISKHTTSKQLREAIRALD